MFLVHMFAIVGLRPNCQSTPGPWGNVGCMTASLWWLQLLQARDGLCPSPITVHISAVAVSPPPPPGVQMQTLAGAGVAGIVVLAVLGAVIAKRRGRARGGVTHSDNKVAGEADRRGSRSGAWAWTVTCVCWGGGGTEGTAAPCRTVALSSVQEAKRRGP
jgi:hypothetical protein